MKASAIIVADAIRKKMALAGVDSVVVVASYGTGPEEVCVDVYDIGRHTRQEIVDIAKRHQYTRYDKASGEFADNMLADTPQTSFVNVLFYLNEERNMDVLEFLAANADNDNVIRHIANNCQVSYTVLKRAAQNEIVLPKAIVADICRAIRLFGSNVNRGCDGEQR